MPHRAIFFAAPSLFSARALHAWLELGHEVALFVHPRGAGTRRSTRAWAAQRWSVGAALARHGIPVRALGARDPLDAALPEADVAISVGFPHRIPMPLLRALPRGGVNLHPALLPAFRGPRPLTALCLEDAAAQHGGVSLHAMEAEFDAGPLLAQEAVPLRGDYAAWLLELARAHGRLMQPLARFVAGELAPVAQDASRASYQRPGRVALSPRRSAAEVSRLCRTLGSARRLRVELDGRRVSVRRYLSSAPRSGEPPRVGVFTLDFDCADARVRLARWLPGTRTLRELRWLLRLALARVER